LLEQAASKRDAAPSSIERGGLLRALTWCARGSPEDLARAQATLAEILPLAVDPYRRTVILALAGMVRTTGAP
jgi:hypothetical protein